MNSEGEFMTFTYISIFSFEWRIEQIRNCAQRRGREMFSHTLKWYKQFVWQDEKKPQTTTKKRIEEHKRSGWRPPGESCAPRFISSPLSFSQVMPVHACELDSYLHVSWGLIGAQSSLCASQLFHYLLCVFAFAMMDYTSHKTVSPTAFSDVTRNNTQYQEPKLWRAGDSGCGASDSLEFTDKNDTQLIPATENFSSHFAGSSHVIQISLT